ncbi:MAG: thrombospondin type 3 repeat-containing protein, partial [Candidatus Promineifilaceae bacterium]
MKKIHFPGVPLVLLVLIIGSLWGGVGLPSVVKASPQSPGEIVESAWNLARRSGHYQYRSLVDQTIYPAPSVINAGRPPERDRLAVEGEVDVEAESLNMTFWNDGSFDPQRGISVKVEDGQTYGRRGEGSWQEMDNVADMFAPGGDPLGFLAGATNIQSAGTESRNFDGVRLVYSHYTFEMDGRAFADYMLVKIEAHQEKYGAPPAGMELAPPEAYQRMTGQGDLWINEAGLPARLEMQVEMPDQPKAGERVTAVIDNDFFSFDLTRLEQMAVPFWSEPKVWVNERLPQLETAAKSAVPLLQLLALGVLIAIVSLRYWRTRHFYSAVISLIIVSMVASPMLQAHQGAVYMDRVKTDQEAQQARQDEAEQQRALDSAVDNYRTWQPNQDPLAAARDKESTNGKQVTPTIEQNGLTAPMTTDMALAMMPAGTTDSDSDGLSDKDEAYWGTCAFPFGSPEYNSSADCDNVADPTDSDGDGLSDVTEVNYLNTYPTSADTDGDTITDTLEVEGFTYNGQTWYLNPVDEDTNGDGMVDSGECDLFSGSGVLDLAAACGDLDNDGTPDFADPDNDGDGVPDKDDLSPNNAGNTFYDKDNPFLFSIDNFTEDQPILVDIQLQPAAPEHLDYYNQVLDWPYDDEGQIQRHLDTTWATTNNSQYRSDAANAANGDIRLVPMLEVRMPYTSGHYANLPVNSTYAGMNRPLGVPVDDWLDSDVTAPYSMSIDDLDLATGDLVAYVPLSLVTDDNDTPIAYTTRLIYRPDQPDWGSAHEYRVVWLVQMLTDECIDPDVDPANCARQDVVTVIHNYDETWTLTGLNVSEEHGLDVALMYEDPATDDDLGVDDQLWGASWNLGNTFLRGRDCDSYSGGSCVGNGQRDVTIANLSTNLSAWNLDYTEIESFSYPHQGFAAHIMMTETVSLLDTVFTPYASQTVPTILVAQENASRVVNLDGYEGDLSSGMTADLSPATVPLQVQASLSWASYEYVNEEWQNYDPEAYLEYLSEKLATDNYFQPIDSSQTAEDVADGKLLWAQSYYAMLYQGAQSVVQADDTVVWEPSLVLPETNFEPVIPVNVNWGVSTLAREFAIVYASKRISVDAAETGIWAWFKRSIQRSADNGYQFTRFNKGGLSTNYVALAVLAVAVIGVTVLALGLITGDKTVIRAGVVIISIISIIVTTFYIIAAIQKIAAAVQAAATVVRALSAAMAAGRWFQGVGVIGFIIGVLLTWGAVGVLILSKGLKGVALGTALSLAIAATIVLLIYLILDLIGLGIITYFLILLDALFALFGAKGPTQLLTEAIAAALYGVNFLIKNMDDSNRLALDLAGFSFTDDELGFTIQNSFVFTVAVTNTVRYDDDYSFSNLENRTVFRYFLQDDEIDQHQTLTQGEMVGEWVAVDGDEARASDVLSITIPMSNIGAGIDQSLDGEMYVTEAYIVPYQGCWKFAGIPVDCDWYKIKGSSHINLGQELVYDILPATLSSFARMNWDSQLPVQVDIDNDGLNSA